MAVSTSMKEKKDNVTPTTAHETTVKLDRVEANLNIIGSMLNIMFAYTPTGTTNEVLQWKISNYQRYFAIGKRVTSPIFYTSMQEFAFKLSINWCGKSKENFGLYLHLCRLDYHSTT